MSEKIYVGRAKSKVNKFGSTEIRLSFGDKDFEKLEQYRSNGWVNLVIQTGKNGEPYAVIDTWKPTEQAAAPADSPDELPF